MPNRLGITHDDLDSLRNRLSNAIKPGDFGLLSGGTIKGNGRWSYRVVAEFSRVSPCIVAHGVALKPSSHLSAANRRPPCIPCSAGLSDVVDLYLS